MLTAVFVQEALPQLLPLFGDLLRQEALELVSGWEFYVRPQRVVSYPEWFQSLQELEHNFLVFVSYAHLCEEALLFAFQVPDGLHAQLARHCDSLVVVERVREHEAQRLVADDAPDQSVWFFILHQEVDVRLDLPCHGPKQLIGLQSGLEFVHYFNEILSLN